MVPVAAAHVRAVPARVARVLRQVPVVPVPQQAPAVPARQPVQADPVRAHRVRQVLRVQARVPRVALAQLPA
ncbi:hypothetical protein ADIAG_01168 [Paeniglutamicibacter gangotriensis Lz1y]|uniref:Uncharacterized protein n=1 Tax=Paeniglutamicibacter gangotriensis Lz1y TaxID=1276920 RepID=M7NKU8_9MICC|nr:hypothetical protein ADIAG_01168 [Paeniglutamicibacter gangotriensis Lz1y]